MPWRKHHGNFHHNVMKMAVFMPWRKHHGNFHHNAVTHHESGSFHAMEKTPWQFPSLTAWEKKKKEMRYFKFYSSKYRIIYIYCIYIYMYACMHACMYVCIISYVYIYVYICICICLPKYFYILLKYALDELCYFEFGPKREYNPQCYPQINLNKCPM